MTPFLLIVFALFSAFLPASTRAVRLLVPIVERDTASHVDVQTSHVVQLRAIALDSVGHLIPDRPVKWSSGNASVAKVSTSGVVSGVSRGYATVTAKIDGLSATTRVCVTAVEREEIPFVAASMTYTTARELRGMHHGDTTRATAHIQEKATGSIQWGQCVHWRVDEATARVARIDRLGVLHSSTGAVPLIVHAYLGPSIP